MSNDEMIELENLQSDTSYHKFHNANSKVLSYDQIMEQYIGWGKYQNLCFITPIILSISDGAEAIVISFLLPVLKRQWTLNQFQQNWLGTTIFIGFALGGLIGGNQADKYGRKRILQICNLGLFLASFLSGIAPNYNFLLLVRLIYGFFLGMSSPVAATYVTEFSTIEKRGKMLILFWIFFPIGELLTCLVAYLCLNDLESGNWRALLIWISIPGLITYVLGIFYMEESPRYLLISNKTQEGITLLQKIRQLNRPNSPKIPDYEINRLLLWCESQEKSTQSQVENLKSLFTPQNKTTTILLWEIWYLISLIYYGSLFIFPTVVADMYKKTGQNEPSLTSKEKQFGDVTFAVVMDFIIGIFSYYLIENRYFGRIRSMQLAFFVSFLGNLLAYFLEGFPFIFLASVARGILDMGWLVLYPYTCEVYPTALRATGSGMANGFSRFGGISMPWVTFYFMRFGITAPFLLFSILSFVCLGLVSKMPYETMGKELDKSYLN